MKEKPRREKYGFFLLETLKTSFKMRNLTQDGHNQGTFFQFLKKGRETRDLPPLPPSSFAPDFSFNGDIYI